MAIVRPTVTKPSREEKADSDEALRRCRAEAIGDALRNAFERTGPVEERFEHIAKFMATEGYDEEDIERFLGWVALQDALGQALVYMELDAVVTGASLGGVHHELVDITADGEPIFRIAPLH